MRGCRHGSKAGREEQINLASCRSFSLLLAMSDASIMTASLIAPGSCSSRLSFFPWLCCVLGCDGRQTADERQTIGRRDELVHVLHLLRLPCPHNEETSKPVHSVLRRLECS
jgi:hypothetical protein